MSLLCVENVQFLTHSHALCIQQRSVEKMLSYVTVYNFRACRAADEASNHVFTLDTCQLTGQVIYIQRAFIGFSNKWNATENPPKCGTNTCLKSTYHNEIMNCNGKQNCTFSQNVIDFIHGTPLCSKPTQGNYVSISYSCIDGKQNYYIPSLFSQEIIRLCNFVFPTLRTALRECIYNNHRKYNMIFTEF